MICPACGQSTKDVRYGVALSPVKARIFDAVKMANEIGVTSYEVIGLVYEGRKKPKLHTIKSHIFQINEMLANTNFRIISVQDDKKHWFWVLTKRRETGKWDKK